MGKGLDGVKKGETVVLLGFTGIRLADMVVTAADKKTLTVTKQDGTEMVFDRKTGIQQVEEGRERWANKLSHVDDAPAKKERKPATKPAPKQEAKPAAKPKKGKPAPKAEEDEYEEV